MDGSEKHVWHWRDLWELYAIFARVGLFTVGGGYAMLPILRREMVEQRGWVKDEELLDYYAIGQATPGIIAVNTATFVGCKRAGVVGGVTATLGMVTPSLVIIMLIAAFFEQFQHSSIVQQAFRGIRVGVAVILCFMVVEMARKAARDWFGWVLLVLAFVLVALLGCSPIPVIACAAVVGLLRARLSSGRAA